MALLFACLTEKNELLRKNVSHIGEVFVFDCIMEAQYYKI